MLVQIVNAANNQVLDSCQLQGMPANDFMVWLQKWGMELQAQAILLKSTKLSANDKYIVSCKFTLTYPADK